MTMLEHLGRVVLPAAYGLLPNVMNTRAATVLLLAIALQESKCEHRRQVNGPARGFWQFEHGGGVFGVMVHKDSAAIMAGVLKTLRYTPDDSREAYAAIEHNDTLAAVFARLLLWTDPAPLPSVGEADRSWDYYRRNWRPGRPHEENWRNNYAEAMAVLL